MGKNPFLVVMAFSDFAVASPLADPARLKIDHTLDRYSPGELLAT